MDEEIKKLKIRYQNEKEEITAKYVAEQSAGCYGKKAKVNTNVTGRSADDLRERLNFIKNISEEDTDYDDSGINGEES